MKGYSFIKEKEQTFKKENRTNKRYKYNNKFKIECVNREKVNMEVRGVELSISGIGFISNFQFKVNDMLEISFKYNNVTIPVFIKIQHVNLADSCFFVGGQFMALQESYRNVLKNLI